MRPLVRSRRHSKVVEGLNQLWIYRWIIVDCSAPHRTLFESWQIEFCDDAEIVRSSFQGDEKIMVVLCVGLHDVSRSKNDFEVYHVVADETSGGREIG